MVCIPIVYNRRLRVTWGLYRQTQIDLNIHRGWNFSINTLLHELAHHLKRARFMQHKDGYYKVFNYRENELYRVDKNGEKWYSATGEQKTKYFEKGTSHDKIFRECLKDITEYFKEELQIYVDTYQFN